ncbi:3-phosphoserine/phosphohydroxythreonine transaminase [Alteromonas oceanisediminis]|uniref:3-phosphoserine/phosphohydroxythreonine transaminase n=1 Tax=Alteromonas oceanisediminis TaxID=2836180 RepID=UPI001BD9A008|nr:3-phosphoserine/phosphohydroxythreonine transaminase [Alteromonas oceanisediminis]MBT0586356.1 3-phosphoserine/phosphohydroxythreonine transaminase [Alteromonas oceanisediminis]
MTVYNFSAGPAMLPADVMAQAQQEFLDWGGLGTSVMEISHRSAEFMRVAAESEADLRQLMNIPEDYTVLFMHGGGRGQFAAVPLNLAQPHQHGMHLVSGSWSKAAVVEASKYIHADSADIRFEENGIIGADVSLASPVGDDTAFVHYCPNETVDGIELFDVPSAKVPIVADMSSNILSREINVADYGLIYASAQKNIGPSGLAVVIVKTELLGGAQPQTPVILDYTAAAQNESMFNTPPTYSWYLSGLVFKWLLQNGGVAAIEAVNRQKAALLYKAIDASDLFVNRIAPQNRSLMNVVFQLRDESLNAQFLTESVQHGLHALKGHRSVGGMRASIYNPMPLAGVQCLVEFMQEFERTKG